MDDRKIVMGENGNGIAISLSDSTICFTRDGGHKWSEPISLGPYRYCWTFEYVPKCTIKNDDAYLFLATSEDYRILGPYRAGQHLAKFNFNELELTLTDEKFQNPKEIHATESLVVGIVGDGHIIEFDHELSNVNEFDISGCLSLVPYKDGYCAVQLENQSYKLLYYLNGNTTKVDLDIGYYKGSLFCSKNNILFIFCRNHEGESVILRIDDQWSSVEVYQNFERRLYCSSFSCGDAFFVTTFNMLSHNRNLIYSLDGGNTWSVMEKLPYLAAARHNMAYYDGKLFY